MTFRYSTLACPAANILILPLNGLVLRILGRADQETGHLALMILRVGGFGTAVKDDHVAMARSWARRTGKAIRSAH